MAAPVISGSVVGYSAEYLSPEQQERFTFVKTKVCENKAVDVPNLEKNGMNSIAETLRRMQWMDIATFTEVSYPDLVKAFYVCLRSEADGSLVSSVKGIQIKVDHELLHMLFGVKTSGHSGVHTVNDQAKGLSIIRPGFRLRDGKLDINQMTAFNHLLHFIICQIMVPRSATFSTCTRANSDMMFWVIQQKEINMAEVMMERMKFAHDQIWDTKSKLNVSLPYAHLLTKIFKHFGVNLSGAVVEKMGQFIRSRNLKKSGFSVQNGIWTKTSVAEGETIIGDVPEIPEEAADPPAELEGEAVAVSSEIGGLAEEEAMAPGHTENLTEVNVSFEVQTATQQEVIMEEVPSQGEPNARESQLSESVAEGLIEEIVLEEAPTQGEQENVEHNAPIQGEQIGNEESIMENAPETDAPSQGNQASAKVPVNEGQVQAMLILRSQSLRKAKEREWLTEGKERATGK
ncbi:hypothetical protein Taro_056503 [Colocasia esculenta]|uniref:Putative plant transposon protein domain-containing protein n=1 Tax=Colocasia esculenta TaxID=4460 RepID=A0A843XU46_COLES|nr:hypothetical protein [Colocasia esculenta]